MPKKRHNVPQNVFGGGRVPFRTSSKHPIQGMSTDFSEDMGNEHIKKHVQNLGLKQHHVRQGFKHHPSTFKA